jgi:glycosyltransferase involved in cell wall biosynthesis
MVFWLFIALVSVQCGIAVYFFMRICTIRGPQPLPAFTEQGVSIVICAKNESANLTKNLPAILSRNYKDSKGINLFEVIVVNDASTDDTDTVLRDLEKQYNNLRHIEIRPDELRTLKGKKHALTRGMEHARFDWLVLTDADCVPASDEWLRRMVAPLAQGKVIVAGYGGFHKTHGLLNALIRWETLHTFLQYSTYALAGVPYMAVGRNLACTRAALQKAAQDPLWNITASGDDDMLVRIAGTSDNVAVVCDTAAFTYSDAKATWHEWMQQKQRHLSTGKNYKPHIKLFLGAYGLSHALMWLSFFVLLFSGHWQLSLAVMGARCLLYWVLWGCTAARLQEKSLIYLFPLFDIAWLVYNFAFFPYITWKNKQHWK